MWEASLDLEGLGRLADTFPFLQLATRPRDAARGMRKARQQLSHVINHLVIRPGDESGRPLCLLEADQDAATWPILTLRNTTFSSTGASSPFQAFSRAFSRALSEQARDCSDSNRSHRRLTPAVVPSRRGRG